MHINPPPGKSRIRSVAYDNSSSVPSKNSQPTTGLLFDESEGRGRRIFFRIGIPGRSQALKIRSCKFMPLVLFIRPLVSKNSTHVGVSGFLPRCTKHFYRSNCSVFAKLAGGERLIDPRHADQYTFSSALLVYRM